MARKFVSKGLEPTPEVDIVERLTPSMASGRKRRVGGSGLTFVGTLVNPKTLRPYMVFRAHTVAGVIAIPTSGDHVVILGHGYLETEGGDYQAPAEAFGLPRVHTPGGVADKGGGMGTVLYVGMALVATYLHRVAGDHSLPVEGDGVCSGYGASTEAQRWWRNAEKAGLARGDVYHTEERDERSDPRKETEDFTEDLDDWEEDSRLDDIIKDHTDQWASDTSDARNYDTYTRQHEVVVEGDAVNADGETFSFKEVYAFNRTSYKAGDALTIAEGLLHGLIGGSAAARDDVTEIHVTRARLQWNATVEWEETVEVDVEEAHDGYLLPIENAVEQRLILDVAPKLDREWNESLSDFDILDVLVELDLREVTDPVALRYFYGLAERRGASYAQLTRMRNRAEAAKSYYQTLEFPDPDEASEEMFETMGKKGVRVMNPIRSRLRNPVDAKEDAAYQAAARRLFPKLSKILPQEFFATRHHDDCLTDCARTISENRFRNAVSASAGVHDVIVRSSYGSTSLRRHPWPALTRRSRFSVASIRRSASDTEAGCTIGSPKCSQMAAMIARSASRYGAIASRRFTGLDTSAMYASEPSCRSPHSASWMGTRWESRPQCCAKL